MTDVVYGIVGMLEYRKKYIQDYFDILCIFNYSSNHQNELLVTVQI